MEKVEGAIIQVANTNVLEARDWQNGDECGTYMRFEDSLINKTCTISVQQGLETEINFLTDAIFVGGGALIKRNMKYPNKKMFFGVEGLSNQEGFDLVIFWEMKISQTCRNSASVLVNCEEDKPEEGKVYWMETINDHRGDSSRINFQVYGVKPETFLQIELTQSRTTEKDQIIWPCIGFYSHQGTPDCTPNGSNPNVYDCNAFFGVYLDNLYSDVFHFSCDRVDESFPNLWRSRVSAIGIN
ncbi:Oidioi.mRNA.OKI2018_I69.PAR.g9759.t1.cds [Oikopleura dioica]|uniref:Oidioi.mRNA.OKI2018_I69.PAR.g9759.t1.cds n=1 Tax=Oikopleura dioica TaxID=34765 RepID=A0ABN7RSZ1_OIKDI|nr:Oidioi.mRNA.OKI2018_I69.PAR.g9759.t1.cds [Oikopleura dioica]